MPKAQTAISLWFFGRDGKMATYAALVVTCATQPVAGRPSLAIIVAPCCTRHAVPVSPAKSLDYDTPVGMCHHTLPQFVSQSTS
jgi:hypothetical protein